MVRTKAIVGNLILALWLLFGLWAGITIINEIPVRFGDNAGALLPAYIVAMVVILFFGRFLIERFLNRVIAESDVPFLLTRTESILLTSMSGAVPVLIAFDAIARTDFLIVESAQEKLTGGDVQVYPDIQAAWEKAASTDFELVHMG